MSNITTVSTNEALNVVNASASVMTTRFYCQDCGEHLETERHLIMSDMGFISPTGAQVRTAMHECGVPLAVPCTGDKVLYAGKVNKCAICGMPDPVVERTENRGDGVTVMHIAPHPRMINRD